MQVRLITETVPELGRVLGSLTWYSDTYSLNGRMWSEQRSLGILSYGVSGNNSLKSSHTVTLLDPTTSWTRLGLALETNHLGSFPYNFQVLML